MILKFIVAVVITEVIAEILTTSVLFESLRAALLGNPENPRLIGILASCGYCQSVWLGCGAAYLLRVQGEFEWLGGFEPLLWGFAVHRAANLLHEILSRIFGRVPFAVSIRSWSNNEPPGGQA